jgi:Ca2+-binding EF-hand superfamily protein
MAPYSRKWGQSQERRPKFRRKFKWNYLCGKKLWAFGLPFPFEARFFHLRTGWCFMCPGRNGILFNPAIEEGDKAQRLVLKKDNEGHMTVEKYVDITVVTRNDDGTIDIVFMDTGRLEKHMHPQQKQMVFLRHLPNGEIEWKEVPLIKGLEYGRVYRLLRWFWVLGEDACFWVKRRIPGCGISRNTYIVQRFGKKSVHGQDVRDTFETLRISKAEQKDWMDIWCEIDADENNYMEFDEFCTFFEVDDTPITRRCYELFNNNATGGITFAEFMRGVWQYCIYDVEKSKALWFSLLAKSGTQLTKTTVIDSRDVSLIIKQFYGNHDLENRSEVLFATLDDDCSGGISYDEWDDFGRGHMILYYPGYWMQNKLRRALFGEKYWQHKTDHRRKLGGFKRNQALEKVLRKYEKQHQLGDDKKRHFNKDFDMHHIAGYRPKKKIDAQIVPFDHVLDPAEIAHLDLPLPDGIELETQRHIKRAGFY